jgi:hypothetical protein
MANQVFANGREVSCKAADGKSICAFPDVCLSPPSPPAGPLPIPYPNTGFASDTTDGSKSVTVSGKEVMLKDKSYFKKSTGDEAATKTLGMGVVTHQITGKVYFTSWSMDVKIESENAVRFMDLTTHDHMSIPGNTPPWMYVDEIATPGGADPCKEDRDRQEKACQTYKPQGPDDACSAPKPSRTKVSSEAHTLGDQVAADDCLAARRCTLQPYKPTDKQKEQGHSCCPSQTPHHLIEASAVHASGRKGATLAGVSSDYREGQALSLCCEGQTQFTGTHGMMHTFQSAAAAGAPVSSLPITGGGTVDAPTTNYGSAKKNAVAAAKKTFPESGCNEACLVHQLDYYHKRQGMDDDTKIKAVQTGDFDQAGVDAATQRAAERSAAIQASRATGGNAIR